MERNYTVVRTGLYVKISPLVKVGPSRQCSSVPVFQPSEPQSRAQITPTGIQEVEITDIASTVHTRL